jgi:hypothetical protein
MALTPKFNSLIIEASHKLHDPRTDPSVGGDATADVYSSVLLSSYANRAIRDLIMYEVAAGDPNKMLNQMPEYVRTSAPIAVGAAAVPRPTDCWIVADMYIVGSKVRFFPVPPEEVVDAITGRNPIVVYTDKRPGFYMEGTDVKIVPITTTIVEVVLRYLVTPPDVVVDTTDDIPLNSDWFGKIIDRMVALGEADAVRIVGAK